MTTTETAAEGLELDKSAALSPQPIAPEALNGGPSHGKPFLYAMRYRADGTPYFDELCVSSDPAELEDYYSDDPSVEVIPLYAGSPPIQPVASPSVTEELDLEGFDADDNYLFGASGPRDRVLAEIGHYAAMYGVGIRVEQVIRQPFDLTAALTVQAEAQGGTNDQ